MRPRAVLGIGVAAALGCASPARGPIDAHPLPREEQHRDETARAVPAQSGGLAPRDSASDDIATALGPLGPRPDAVPPGSDRQPAAGDGAGDAPPSAELRTYMCRRGKLLLSDGFAGPQPSAAWSGSLGTWQIDRGVLQGAEDSADMHRAIIKRRLDYRNAVVQVSIRFAGATLTGVEMDWDRGGGDDHVCRTEVTATRLAVRRDGAAGSAYLDRRPLSLKQGEWYRLLVEVNGPELLAQIDDKFIAFGADPGVDRDKRYIGLGPVEGVEAHFDDLRVWECLPDPAWPEVKKALRP